MRASRFVTALVVLLMGAAAQAQQGSTGTVRIVGHVSEMASLRFHSDAVQGPGVRGVNAGADGALDYTLDLGDVGMVPGRDNGVRGGEVKLILRTNTAYVLTATVVASGFKPGEGEIQLSDIGFGLPLSAVAPSGHRARSEGTQVLEPSFDSDPLEAPVRDGVPEYRATLADLEGGVPVLKGERISYGGSLRSPSNGLLVSTRYAVQPQYFKRNDGFEAVVTYTLATP